MAGTLQLTGLPQSIDSAPGALRNITLTLTNASAIVDQFAIALAGLDDGWYAVRPDTVTLFPGTQGQVEVIVHPPEGTASTSGAYPIEVTVIPVSAPEARATFSSVVTVAKVGQLGMEVRPTRVEGRAATFRLTWQNGANAEALVDLEVRDAEEGLRTRIDPEGTVAVPAGGESSVEIRVKPERRETVGEPHPYQLEFRALRPGTSDLLEPGLIRQAQFIYLPPIRALALPAWLRRLPIWALLLLLLLLPLLALFAGNRVGPHIFASAAPAVSPASAARLPQIGRFNVQANPRGVALAWAVAGAHTVRLNGHAVNPSGQQVLAQSAPRTLILEASGANGSTLQVLRLPQPLTRALRPAHIAFPTIDRFALENDPRTGALRLVWHTTGATAATLNGVTVGPNGSRTLAGGARRSGQYVLRAQNVLGTAGATLIVPGRPLEHTTVIVRLPTIVRFTLSQAHVGAPYRLVWQARDSMHVTLNGRSTPATGSLALPAPLRSMRYLLVATNDNGQVGARVTLHVR